MAVPIRDRLSVSPQRSFQPDMAVSADVRLFFAIFLIICCFTQTLTEVPNDCCLKVKNTIGWIRKARVVDYHQQIRGQGCHIDAIVLVTKHGRTLCVSPGAPRVQNLIKHVDKLKKMCKLDYKNPRCSWVKRDV